VKSSSRSLLIFGIAIGVLVIAAIVLVLTVAKPGETSLLPEDEPGGIVQRYFLALEDGKYQTAYSYLSPPADEELTYEKWRPSAISEDKPEWQVMLGDSTVTGDEATVEVTVDVFYPGGPFDNPVYTHHITFFLHKEGTSWKITSPIYAWFLY
jgi:hypothetical protein